MARKIIIAFDGSTQAHDALALGRLLAGRGDAPLVVVCVHANEPASREGDPSAYGNMLREGAHEVLSEARPLLADLPDTEFRTIAGVSPGRTLQDLAEAENADLVVVGSTSRSAVGRILTGSTGDQVLHSGPCAVAIAPNGFSERSRPLLENIGVAYNGSPEAMLAVQYAARLMRETRAKLTVLDVVDLAPDPVPLRGDGPGFVHHLADVRDSVREELDQAVRAVDSAEATGRLLEGRAAEVLVEESASLDLLCLGSRSYGPVRRLLLGSVSNRVMLAAQCPVLVLPRGSEIADDDDSVASSWRAARSPSRL